MGSRELLLRVAGASHFEKSKRLRDLLLYLGDRALQNPHCTLHEQEIGVDVLGRQPDYDTSHDTLVRVSVSQLRKKLHEYFTTEGHDEAVIIEIPKGSYVPVFRPRPDEFPPEPATWRHNPIFRARAMGLIAGLAFAALVFAIYSLVEARLHHGPKPRPAVDAFWSQVFGNGQTTYLVLADVNLLEYENLIGHSVPLPEYEAHEFEQFAERYLPDPATRALARLFVKRVPTSVSDVLVARDVGIIASNQRATLNLISARDVSSTLASSQNAIFLGSFRANPWVGLFEDHMAFQTEYTETPASMRFINRSPLPGEPAFFPAVWRSEGYCRVAYRQNPKRTGTSVIISGSDVISTEAGGRFLTSEESIQNLRHKLGLSSGAALPYFEVLLHTRIVNNTVPWFEMVAYRPHQQ